METKCNAAQLLGLRPLLAGQQLNLHEVSTSHKAGLITKGLKLSIECHKDSQPSTPQAHLHNSFSSPHFALLDSYDSIVIVCSHVADSTPTLASNYNHSTPTLSLTIIPLTSPHPSFHHLSPHPKHQITRLTHRPTKRECQQHFPPRTILLAKQSRPSEHRTAQPGSRIRIYHPYDRHI
jgi:hypothetical protein